MHTRFFNPDRFITSSLLATADDGGGDGGAGGDDKPVTSAQVQQMIKDGLKDVNKTVNTAVTAQITRALAADAFKTSLADIVKASIGDTVKEALETTRGAQGGAGGAAGGNDDKGGKPTGQTAPEETPAYKALQKQIDKLTQERDAEKTARAKEAEERKVTEEKGILTETLTKLGCAPKRVKAAVALLYTEEKRLARGEDGKLTFRDDEGTELPLEAGLKEWTAGDVGQEFLPARDVKGSGGTGGTHGGAGKGAPGLESVIGDIVGA